MQLPKAVIYLVLFLLALVWIFPIVVVIVSVIKSPEEFYSLLGFWDLPHMKNVLPNTVANFLYAWTKTEIGTAFFNSILYGMGAGIGSAFVASLAGYALVHLNIRAPQAWFLGIFIGNFFPFQMFLIPLYLFLNSLNLYDTRLGLIFVYFGICVPFALFVYRNYAFTIPRELADAARVDGASNWRIYWHIFLPLSKAAFVVVFIFQFTWTWNDLLFGLVLSEKCRPVMTTLARLSGFFGSVPIPVINAGAIIVSIPTVLILLSLQRYFIRGFTIQTEK